MAVAKLFSKRQRELRGETLDVYVYDDIPVGLRVQMVQIAREIIGLGGAYSGRSESAYKAIVEALRREYGVFLLPPVEDWQRLGHQEELAEFILHEPDVERVLDAVELICGLMPNFSRGEEAIAEINGRFKEHGIGFEYTEDRIMRVDSEYVHEEVIKPALRILSDSKYAGARQEFLSAHAHYRSGKTKECLNDCLKAFESTMKSICDRRGWKYKSGATAKDLIQVCLDQDLIPAFWQSHFSSLRAGLEGGVPTGRNKLGGHGQGVSPVKVPDYLAAYMLNMTAATIVFLDRADSAL